MEYVNVQEIAEYLGAIFGAIFYVVCFSAMIFSIYNLGFCLGYRLQVVRLYKCKNSRASYIYVITQFSKYCYGKDITNHIKSFLYFLNTKEDFENFVYKWFGLKQIVKEKK